MKFKNKNEKITENNHNKQKIIHNNNNNKTIHP